MVSMHLNTKTDFGCILHQPREPMSLPATVEASMDAVLDEVEGELLRNVGPKKEPSNEQ